MVLQGHGKAERLTPILKWQDLEWKGPKKHTNFAEALPANTPLLVPVSETSTCVGASPAEMACPQGVDSRVVLKGYDMI